MIAINGRLGARGDRRLVSAPAEPLIEVARVDVRRAPSRAIIAPLAMPLKILARVPGQGVLGNDVLVVFPVKVVQRFLDAMLVLTHAHVGAA